MNEKHKKKSRKGIEITPHKGGRTKQRLVQLTPADAKKLRNHLRSLEISFSDWVSAMLTADAQSWYYTYELPSGEMQAWALADSLGEAIENASFHAAGRKIMITNKAPQE